MSFIIAKFLDLPCFCLREKNVHRWQTRESKTENEEQTGKSLHHRPTKQQLGVCWNIHKHKNKRKIHWFIKSTQWMFGCFTCRIFFPHLLIDNYLLRLITCWQESSMCFSAETRFKKRCHPSIHLLPWNRTTVAGITPRSVSKNRGVPFKKNQDHTRTQGINKTQTMIYSKTTV